MAFSSSLRGFDCVVSLSLNMEKPLILITNDDGIESKGLWAVVEALLPLGELLVVAPDRQWSGAGRSMPHHVTGRLTPADRKVQGQWVRAYAVDATPALAVLHGLLELAERKPGLLVSGINYGENLSVEVTISGTVGAALEAAAEAIPALAISLAMPISQHLTGGEMVDYSAAQAFAGRFSRLLLERRMPFDVDVLNVNLPSDATPETPWRLARLLRRRYFEPTAPERDNGGSARPGYRLMSAPVATEPDSDVHLLVAQGFVTVTPLSLDMTSRVDFGELQELIASSRLV